MDERNQIPRGWYGLDFLLDGVVAGAGVTRGVGMTGGDAGAGEGCEACLGVGVTGGGGAGVGVTGGGVAAVGDAVVICTTVPVLRGAVGAELVFAPVGGVVAIVGAGGGAPLPVGVVALPVVAISSLCGSRAVMKTAMRPTVQRIAASTIAAASRNGIPRRRNGGGGPDSSSPGSASWSG